MKNLIVLLIMLLYFPLASAADTLVLKSGLKLNSEKIWREKGWSEGNREFLDEE